MKNAVLLALVLSLTAAGCANRYKITLTNGNVITTRNKPKLEKESGAYHFKNAQGKKDSIPGFRIKEIEPL
jgi:hypothetical protein